MIRIPLVLMALAALALSGPAASGSTKSPLLSHTGWRATVDRPANRPARLIIRGTLTVRTAGYKAELKAVRHLTSNPPIPVYELVLTRRKDFVAQVISTIRLTHMAPAGRNPPRLVVVRHQGRELARIRVERR